MIIKKEVVKKQCCHDL